MSTDGAVKPSGERRRMVLFLLAGGIAAAVNIASRIALNWAMPYEAAIVVAYLCGMTTAYAINKIWVFDASGRGVTHEYMRFALVNAAAIVQVWLVSVGLARLVFPGMGFAWHAETIAHVIGTAVPIFTSYLGHKHFTFAAAKS